MSVNIFWLDAAMNIALPIQLGKPRLNFVHRNGTVTADAVFYLGFDDTLAKLVPTPESAATRITLQPVDVLPDWEASKAYLIGQIIEPVGGNGYMFRCKNAGTTGASEPSWPVYGAEVVSGTARFVNIGPRFNVSDLKLATSVAGLDSAVAGGGLDLGTQILGGEAIAIHVRVTNPSTIVRSDQSQPCIDFLLTECEFVDNL